jgi:hypothetical protein
MIFQTLFFFAVVIHISQVCLEKQDSINIAHGLHSLTENALKEYFDPNSSKDNGIPVANSDLTSDDLILNHAPALPDSTLAMSSFTMAAVDK